MSTPWPSPWPANFQGCLLTGKFVDLAGQAMAGGGITLVPTPLSLLDAAAAIVIVTKTLSITLGSDGAIHQHLDGTGSLGLVIPATNDPDINPLDWTYTVNENWQGGRKGYSIAAPQGTAIDLVNVSPVPSSGGTPIYRGASGIPLGAVAAPSTATSPGDAGSVAYDATHIYVCIATDTWVRAVLATW